MSLPDCNPCADVPICLEDLEKYSLQDDLYGYVLTCPPGMYCGGPSTLFLECCDGTTMSQTFPLGITLARRNALINDLVAKCARRLLFCEPFDPYQPPPVPPGTDIEYFYSAPASCTVYCPDGTPFTYTVPAGVFVSRSLADATAAAKRLACLRAPEFRICLGPFNACWCADTFQRAIIAIDSTKGPFKVSVIAGTFPLGLALTTQGNSVVISGAATVPGSYNFTLRVTDAFGNSATHAYQLSIIEITTTSIDPYVVGTPYSFQLQAAGGSGNFLWRIVSGTLPSGLALASSGLISGTPTGLSGGGSVRFEAVDVNCETVTASFFTPRITLNGISSTAIKIKRGWAKWTGYDGTLYKMATFSGSVTQTAFPNGNAAAIDAIQCAGAKYEFSGFDSIDVYGRIVTTHARNLSSMCGATPPAVFSLDIVGGLAIQVSSPALSTLLGYCWDTDPLSCGACDTDDTTWADSGNVATFGATDFPTQMLNLNTTNLTALVKSLSGQNFVAGSTNIAQRDTFPINTGFGVYANSWAFVTIVVDGSWDVTLSSEFTDADAESGATRYTSNSLIAENKPNYINYSKDTFLNIGGRTTTVAYQLNCTDLVIGTNYIARVQLRDSSGATTVVSIPFTATARTQVLTGNAPTPSANHTIRVLNPTIIFDT